MMLKYMMILLLLMGNLFAHENGIGHLHLIGFLHSSDFLFLIITLVFFYSFLKYKEQKNV